MSRADVAIELESGDRDRVSRALVRAALHDPDRVWLEELLMRFLVHDDPWLRGIASKCSLLVGVEAFSPNFARDVDH